MGGKNQKRLTALLFLATVLTLPLSAQTGQRDSLVRLVKATSVQLIEKYGLKYRKAVDATFLHNGTYLICDTALWNVDRKVINSEGHVQIIQDETLLTSDRLDYYIDRDLAEFRGSVVQLTDKDRNILRTRNLDYNTKDSVAVFRGGGAMKDKDGQIIESDSGTYDSKTSKFDFTSNVNMFTDSVFVKTESLLYDGNSSKAWFNSHIDFWKDGNMMSSERGWYERGPELFFFTGRVHALSKEQEAWSDTLYYHRALNDVHMFGNAQIQDTTRNVTAVADCIIYEDSLARVTLSRNAAVALRTDSQGERPDTIFFGADTLIYRTIRMCDIPEDEVKAAQDRMADMDTDPVREYRTKAAREAAEAAEEAARNDPNHPMNRRKAEESGEEEEAPVAPKQAAPEEPESVPAEEEGGGDTEAPADSLLVTAVADSLALPAVDSLALAVADSLAIADSLAAIPPPDTTKVGFAWGIGDVKVFRQDIQVRCDSMRYCDLDSIARFYIDPVVWNDGNRQYTSDSLFVLVREGKADRASLLSNAFIITQEDTVCFDQIKSTEVMAYFDSTAALKRFDALGGATALFYLEEKGAFATVNKVESKMLSAFFKDGQLDQVFYFDQPHNDAYPVVQMPQEDKRMKGFNWQPENRPRGRGDITDLRVRQSERRRYESIPRASFKQTDIYFPGYMKGVYKEIAERDAQKKMPKPVKPAESVPEEVASEPAPADSTGAEGVVAVADSLEVGAPADSLSIAPADSLTSVQAADSTRLTETKPLSEKEIKRAERKAKADARKAAREARWAELDARDAAKAEAKAAKAQARKREATRRTLQARAAQEERDRAKFEKYKARFEKRKAREDARKARKKAEAAKRSRKDPSGFEPFVPADAQGLPILLPEESKSKE